VAGFEKAASIMRSAITRCGFLVLVVLPLRFAGSAIEQAQAGKPSTDAGAAAFETYCSGCHIDASGARGENPPLERASWVVGPEQRLIKIVLHGVRGPIDVNGSTYDLYMPPHGHLLTDAETASLVWYVRRRFGGVTAPIAPDMVRAVRTAHAARTAPWTADELLKDP
jgi:mono/diheme cytochrome c family protein